MLGVPGAFVPPASTFYGVESLRDGLVVEVGGMVSGLYRNGSLRIRYQLNGRSDAQAEFFDQDSSLELEPGRAFDVYQGRELIFSGTVHSHTDVIPSLRKSAREKLISVTAVDHSQIADRHLVAGIYEAPGQTAGDIVREIAETYLDGEGLSLSGVQDGLEVGKVLFDYASVARAFDQLADLIGYAWYIDCHKVLHFVARESFAAPWDIDENSKPFGSLRCTRTRAKYRNRQIIRAGKETGEPRVREFLGDGEQSTWSVEFPIAEEPLVLVGGVQQSVGVRGVDDDGNPEGFAFFWQKDSNSVSQNREHARVEAPSVVRIEFRPFLSIIAQSTDDGEVAARAAIEGGTGLYEDVEDDDRIQDAGHAIEIAISRLRKYGRIACMLDISTKKGGLRPGMVQQIDLDAEGTSGGYLIDTLEANDLGGKDGNLYYRYRAVDGESVGGWPEFFRRLAEQGRRFVIQENEVLLQLSQATGQLVLTHTAEGETGDQLEDAALDLFTTFQVGSPIGTRYDYEGTIYNRGLPVG